MKKRTVTQKEKDRIPEIRDKWMLISRCTRPANRPAAEDGIRSAYIAAELEPPGTIIWAQSPFSMLYGAAVAETAPDALTGWDGRWQSLKEDHPPSPAILSQVRSMAWDCYYGQFESGWLAFYDFFRTACGMIDETQYITGLMQIAQSCGWILPHKDVCYASERPLELHVNPEGMLHNDTGPAIRWPDDFCVWALGGARVPKYVIMDPSRITVSDISNEVNAEVRRIKTERYKSGEPVSGWQAYMADAGASIIDHDERYGTLYRLDRGRDVPPACAVLVVNRTPEPDGSFKKYMIPVHPECRPIYADGSLGDPQPLSARAAVASTFGLTAEEYSPEFES